MDDQEDTSRLRASEPTSRPPIASSPTLAYEETPPITPISAPKKKKRLLVILILIASILLICALTYALWFQNSNKVVSDGIMQAIAAKTLTYTGTVTSAGNTKTTITLDGQGSGKGNEVNAHAVFDTQGKKYTLEGSGVLNDAGDLFFKIKNIDDLANNYRTAIPAQSQPLFDKIIAKVNDKWIKISSEDLKNYNENVATAQKCFTDATKKIQDDSATKSEIMTIYKKSPFITIDKNLGNKEGSLGYSLTSDQEKAKSFAKAFKDTAVYKTLQKCDSSFTINDSDPLKQSNNKGDKTNVEIWVQQWTHEITKLTVKSGDASNRIDMTINPIFNHPVTITTPKDATTLEQLQKDVEELLKSASQG